MTEKDPANTEPEELNTASTTDAGGATQDPTARQHDLEPVAPDRKTVDTPSAKTPDTTAGKRNGSTAVKPSGKPATATRTRISAAWAAVAVAVVVLVLLLVFILQNQDQVTVTFFNATSQLPLGVLLLFAACGGALVVIILGIARMLQLHWLARRDRRTADKRGPAQAKP